MATSRQTIIEIKVQPKAIGAVIGRQGASVKEVRVSKHKRVNRVESYVKHFSLYFQQYTKDTDTLGIMVTCLYFLACFPFSFLFDYKRGSWVPELV